MGTVYLLTVNYYSAELIQRLLRSLENSPLTDWHCLIINNSPADHAIHALTSPAVQIIETGANLGFGGGCNVGLQWVYERQRDAIAWLLNPDTVLEPGTLERAVQFCQDHSEWSIIGTVIREPTGNIWFAGGEFDPNNGKILAAQTLPSNLPDYWPTAWVTGCSMILNLKHFATCPQFNPQYFLYYEDFDFSRRYAGAGLIVTQQIQVTHYPSSITSRDPGRKLQHSTYSYLLALEHHTHFTVLLYRLGRIVGHALRKSVVEPQTAIAIIKGVLNYLARGRSIDSSHHDQSGISAR